jgi:hypothetical protein
MWDRPASIVLIVSKAAGDQKKKGKYPEIRGKK